MAGSIINPQGQAGQHSAQTQALLLAASGASFDVLLEQLISPDNATRELAETQFNQFKNEQSDVCIGKLLALLRDPHQPRQSRSFATVLTRRVCLNYLKCRNLLRKRFHGINIHLTTGLSELFSMVQALTKDIPNVWDKLSVNAQVHLKSLGLGLICCYL